MRLEKYSLGIGDRFGREGKAQLAALLAAREAGIALAPVWNKSAREHELIGSSPSDTKAAAEAAVTAAGWEGAYHLDADHVTLKTVDAFLETCDFFTLDAAEFIGRPASEEARADFIAWAGRFIGKRLLPGGEKVARAFLEAVAGKYLVAVMEAGRIYRRVAGAKGGDDFITEISIDEADASQTPEELFFILGAAAREKIPVRTIAPKWSGRFNKGVDYEGDPARFEDEFSSALDAVVLAIEEFGLPVDLKLSVHSGSDKFRLYPIIRRALEETGAGLHVKTAGTTWLEEVIGLAEAGGEGWDLVKELYRRAAGRFDELCGPYRTVLEIDRGRLPAAETLAGWSGDGFARALRHDEAAAEYNPHLRQFLHVSYKIAAEMGKDYLGLLDTYAGVIGRNVTVNLLERHILPLFPPGNDGR